MTEIYSSKIIINASAVVLNQQGVLILGESGSGKSQLLLQLMARGFELICDDIVMIALQNEDIEVQAPERSRGRFEVRSIGIHAAKFASTAPLKLVADLDCAPASRLPETEYYEQFGKKISKLNVKGFTPLADYLYLLMTQKISKLDLDKM